jgi:hypothetical protein
MGYFSKPDGEPVIPGNLAPLTRERITALLDSEGYKYDIDDDGDVWAGWPDTTFWFLTMGQQKEILMLRGRWDKRLELTDAPIVLPILDKWHREHFFPRALTVPFEDDGDLRIFTEVVIDCEYGITDEQMQLHLRSSLSSTWDLIAELKEAFPNARD